jgi:hypothetical protein
MSPSPPSDAQNRRQRPPVTTPWTFRPVVPAGPLTAPEFTHPTLRPLCGHRRELQARRHRCILANTTRTNPHHACRILAVALRSKVLAASAGSRNPQVARVSTGAWRTFRFLKPAHYSPPVDIRTFSPGHAKASNIARYRRERPHRPLRIRALRPPTTQIKRRLPVSAIQPSTLR